MGSAAAGGCGCEGVAGAAGCPPPGEAGLGDRVSSCCVFKSCTNVENRVIIRNTSLKKLRCCLDGFVVWFFFLMAKCRRRLVLSLPGEENAVKGKIREKQTNKKITPKPGRTPQLGVGERSRRSLGACGGAGGRSPQPCTRDPGQGVRRPAVPPRRKVAVGGWAGIG